MHSQEIATNLKKGVVFRKSTGSYLVLQDGRMIPCAISNKLRKELLYPTANPNSIRPHVVGVRGIQVVDPVAIGDEVNFIDAGDGSGMILEVLPRRNKLTRRSAVPMPSAHPFEQVIVANVSQVMPVFSVAQPEPNWNLLDRYLVSAESSELQAVICMTKMDLVPGESRQELLKELEIYQEIGYPVLLTSTITGEGLEPLRQRLKDQVTVLMGKSGVGKSSLLNTMQPGLGLRVNEVNRKTGRGKHTTTLLEMFPLQFGGSVVDTPGLREFGLWEVDDADLALFFPEMRPFVGCCRFGLDCSHTHEPGCAIRAEVQRGTISQRRYESLVKLRED